MREKLSVAEERQLSQPSPPSVPAIGLFIKGQNTLIHAYSNLYNYMESDASIFFTGVNTFVHKVVTLMTLWSQLYSVPYTAKGLTLKPQFLRQLLEHGCVATPL